MLITDMIMGRDNPWSILYDPARRSPLAALTYAKENLNVAAQYSSWLTPGEVESTAEIRPGTGAVIRRGLSKKPLYRDQSGNVHERSAVCPHLGCIVAWNTTESSSDCPCDGRVLNGPAISALAEVEPEAANSTSAANH